MKKIFILIAGLYFTACNNADTQHSADATPTRTEDTPPTEQTAQASIAKALSRVTEQERIAFNGTLELPPQYIATVSLTMGGIVKHTQLLPGAYVKKETLLATLENPEFIELQQTFIESHAQTAYFEAEYTRQQILSKEEVASQKRLQQSRADYLSMKSRMQASAAQLSLLGMDTALLLNDGIQPYLAVKAPISGYISEVQLNVGKHIAAGEQICEIIDKSQMLLRLMAYEKDIASLQVGDRIEFTVNGIHEKTFEATLISIGQHVDPVNRSLEVYARVHKSEPLFRPGMYVAARLLPPDKKDEN